MIKARREGPARRAKAVEWPLDGILVGVGTLRVLRELFSGRPRWWGSRAWDLAGWCGVTTQGATRALERLEETGLVFRSESPEPGRACSWWLRRKHPLYEPLRALFEAEAPVGRVADNARRSFRVVSRPATSDPRDR